MAKLINILLRKTDRDYPWGFTLGALPPALHSVQITWVDKGSLASEHLEPGDRVLEIEGIDTTMLSNSEVEAIVTNPSNKLELLIMKKNKPVKKPIVENQEVIETKTVKTKDTVSSTTEERGETKILNEDFMEESKIITREGTLHRQIMETTECSENELKTDTSFWTCPPSDLVKQESKTKDKEQDFACRNTSGSSYISESTIFKSLNNYRDELRKIDPREEKRQFWESCRKGDSVRRFKWGDSVKPNRGPSPAYKSDGSMESLYSKSESQAYPFPKVERSKSCEPMDRLPSSNPFSGSFPGEFQTRAELNSTNPFYKEFESLNQVNCDSSSDSKSIESEFKTTKVRDQTGDAAHFNESLKRDYFSGDSTENHENVSSTTVNEQFIKQQECVKNIHSKSDTDASSTNFAKYDHGLGMPLHEIHNNIKDKVGVSTNQQDYVSSTTVGEQFINKDKEFSSNITNKTVRFSDSNNGIPSEIQCNVSPKPQPMRYTKAMGKEEFETKCKFFEKATSVPVLCANKNAKDLVEERLKETSTPTFPSMSPSLSRRASGSSSEVSSFSDVLADESHLHLLKKPSDFINQQFKCKPTANPTQKQSQSIPKIKVLDPSQKEVSDDMHYGNQPAQYQSSHNSQVLSSDTSRGLTQPQPEYANISGHIENCKSVEMGNKATDTRTSERSSFIQGESVNWNSTGTRNTPREMNMDNISAKNVGSNLVSDEQSSSEVNWETNHTSYGSSRSSGIHVGGQQPQTLHDTMRSGVQWFTGSGFPAELLAEQRSRRDIERDFYEKRTFKESSFEKVTRCSNSPYENVESASSREYQEESGPSKNASNRSTTPAGFYDNSNVGEVAREMRAKSPFDISSKSFEDIRNRLGSLLGATPINISCEKSKLRISRGGFDHIEEAFEKLALQEGIVGNAIADQVADP